MSTISQSKRPFHETVIDLIDSIVTKNGEGILLLSKLIITTEIPAGHDEIIAAIQANWGQLGCWKQQVQEVIASLLEQKQAMAAKTDTKHVNIKSLARKIAAEIRKTDKAKLDVIPLLEKIGQKGSLSLEEQCDVWCRAVETALIGKDFKLAYLIVERFPGIRDDLDPSVARRLMALLD
ncbi:MAG: hypothetical protein WCT08_04690 [Patescibacteria group bacterium]|jgi:hypothetical protein